MPLDAVLHQAASRGAHFIAVDKPQFFLTDCQQLFTHSSHNRQIVAISRSLHFTPGWRTSPGREHVVSSGVHSLIIRFLK